MEQLESFADNLYPMNLYEFKRGGKDKHEGKRHQLVRDVLAMNVMHFNEKLHILGLNNAAIHNTIITAEALGIKLADLKDMSCTIKEHFEATNPPYPALNANVDIVTLIADTNRINAGYSKDIAELKSIMKALMLSNFQLHSELQQEQVTPRHSLLVEKHLLQIPSPLLVQPNSKRQVLHLAVLLEPLLPRYSTRKT